MASKTELRASFPYAMKAMDPRAAVPRYKMKTVMATMASSELRDCEPKCSYLILTRAFIRSQPHENRVLDPAQHLQDAHELDATARRIGASAEENGDDDEDDDAIGYRPANLLGIHGLHAACRRSRDHGGQAVLHKPAQAREKSLARHDPSHEGDEHHDPQRIHPQLGIAPDMLETANPRIRIHAKANGTGDHERAQHELQRERVVIDEIRGMGHEAARADGGQRQPEPGS